MAHQPQRHAPCVLKIHDASPRVMSKSDYAIYGAETCIYASPMKEPSLPHGRTGRGSAPSFGRQLRGSKTAASRLDHSRHSRDIPRTPRNPVAIVHSHQEPCGIQR